ncbi:Uma2 family endonuclease [Kitasatospora azatica]|uniref:Uma2 family endonuclease n=1 Tax=Kitasatospora azatica TaxID=58347 RepID=UPI00068D55BF|nr:Uma2 family endonuclease [Kitasatospora azatica]
MSTDAAAFATLRQIADLVSAYGEVEITDRQVSLALPPTAEQHEVARRLGSRLSAQLPRLHPELAVRPSPVVEDPGPGRRYRPDLVVGEAPGPMLLVVEVVSAAGPARDCDAKVRDYAAMGFLNYLLVDPREGTGIVYSQPGYSSREKFAFGDTITVGPWTLDTSGLPSYGPDPA